MTTYGRFDAGRNSLSKVLAIAGIGLQLLMACNAPTPPALDNPNDGGGETIVFPPQGVQIYASSYHSILLRWRIISRRLTGIAIERSVDGGPYEALASLSPWTNLYNDQTVNAFYTYTYRLRSFDSVGWGAPAPPLMAAYTYRDFSSRFGMGGLSGTVTSIAFEYLSTNQWVAAGDDEGHVGIWWCFGVGAPSVTGAIGIGVTDLQYSPAANMVAIAAMDSTLRVGVQGVPWKLPSIAGAVDFSKDGQSILAGCEDGSIRQFTLQGQQVKTLSPPGPVAVTDLSVSRDGTLMISCWSDGTLRLWNTSDYSIRNERNVPEARSCGFASDGNRIAVFAPSLAQASIFDTDGLTLGWQFTTGLITSSAFMMSPDNYMCGAVGGPALHFWKFLGQDPTVLAHMTSRNLTALAFAHDGSSIVVGGSNGYLEILSVDLGWEETAVP